MMRVSVASLLGLASHVRKNVYRQSTAWTTCSSVHAVNSRATPMREMCSEASSITDEVKVERLSGMDEGIVVFSLDRPLRKNAIGLQFLRQLEANLAEVEADRTARVIILQSLVEGVFCAGADLKERRSQTAAETQRFVTWLRNTFAELENLGIPSIAAVEGKALGGGCELALACDIRVAGGKAAFALPETGLAIIPGAGGTQRLPRAVRGPVAKEMILTGLEVGSEKAERIGLVNYSVEAGLAYEKALEIARKILTRGPLGVRMAKMAIDRGSEVDLSTGLAFEAACYAQLLPTTDRLEALEAFREKRVPKFRGE
eukprot:TRINITY_DN13648_c0_g1_i1.p1 TRINITY_DN13648_c0_g1~~TRINITY_DN13648_c0_g1_i1.p1  ORF type:complete len:316 (+),score=45.60 TRINITY_DN13648_c0_g1_i1:199-1146(+)